MRKPKIQVQILFSLPKMKTYDEVKKEIEDLKKQNRDLRDELNNEKYGSKKRWEKEKDLAMNYLQLFGGFGDGIKIPLDAEMKKEITAHILAEMRKILETDKDMEELFVTKALNYKKAFVNIFTPVVKEIIEDLDLNVSFK